MPLGGENKLIQVQNQVLLVAEQQKQIFKSLRQHERIHAVLLLGRAHVVDGGVAARHPRVPLQRAQHRPAHLQVVRIVGGAVQEVRRLEELGPQGVVAPVHLEVGGERFRYELVAAHHLVEHFVRLDRRLDVALEHLQAGPEGEQGVHVVA